MSINIGSPNYLGARLVDSGMGDLIKNAMEAYKGSMEARQAPRKFEEEQRQRELANSMAQENVQYRQTENQFLPQEKQQEALASALKSDYQALVNAGYPAAQAADLAVKRSQAGYHNIAAQGLRQQQEHYPEEQASKNLLRQAQADEAKERTDVSRLMNKQFKEGAPPNAISFAAMPAVSRNAAFKDQRDMQEKVNGANRALNGINKMKEIIRQNPNMSRNLVQILANPDEKNLVSKLISGASNQKELAAAQKFQKYASDLVLAGGAAMGGAAFTDAKAKLLGDAKAKFGNTDEANLEVLDNMEHHFAPLVEYGNDLSKSITGRYWVPYDENAYSQRVELKKSMMEEDKRQGNNGQFKNIDTYIDEELEEMKRNLEAK